MNQFLRDFIAQFGSCKLAAALSFLVSRDNSFERERQPTFGINVDFTRKSNFPNPTFRAQHASFEYTLIT